MSIQEKLKKQILYFDGSTGVLLQSMGLKAGEKPETWNLLYPQLMKELHFSYYEAGADIIKTNTFGANSIKYSDELKSVVSAAMNCAVSAKEKAQKLFCEEKYVALDIGPLGKLLQPLGDLDFEEAVRMFSETVSYGAEQADIVLIETMTDIRELKAAVLAVKESCSLPIFATVSFEGNGKLLTGADPAAVVALLEGLGVSALGVNCGLGPVEVYPMVQELAACCSLPLIANPNAGLPREVDGKTVFDITPEKFAEAMDELCSLGVHVLGGCCGTTPEHISAMVDRTRGRSPQPLSDKGKTVISSFTHVVEFDDVPVIIGERINPTGKRAFKEALRHNDTEYIAQAGISQRDAGADALDVNVGLPDIDERAMMVAAVETLQRTVDLPLQIDTSDVSALASALRIYAGKPLINSVNGKEESMSAVFPLAKKYGGVVIALTLDEGGIPSTAQGRLNVARKILAVAESYGISKNDIIFDPLTMTVSTDNNAAHTTLEAVRLIKSELGAKTSLGVTNISFGLPRRELINSLFFALALDSGLDAAIINPNSAEMMNVYKSFLALTGQDSGFSGYIAYTDGEKQDKPSMEKDVTLKETIEKGLRRKAAELAAAMLQSSSPLGIINSDIVPALESVGILFEKDIIFLPQLLMSADAAKSAFGVLKDYMDKSGSIGEKKYKIVLATVKGDIHDIGKNIVKTLLENYNYDVIDLGKDVSPVAVVEAARENGATLVGLSALMTTTAPAMAETIALLKKECPGVRTIVGGAVITQEYANKIGAGAYAADAMATVRYCESLSEKF